MSELRERTGYLSRAAIASRDEPPNLSYCPQSEERIVRLQILHRNEIDSCYSMLLYAEDDMLYQTSGVPIFREDIACTYIDLDMLLQTCGLTFIEELTVTEVMKGHSLPDISEEHGLRRADVYAAMKSSIEKVVKANDLRWRKCYQKVI